jgi:hypothetical protein
LSLSLPFFSDDDRSSVLLFDVEALLAEVLLLLLVLVFVLSVLDLEFDLFDVERPLLSLCDNFSSRSSFLSSLSFVPLWRRVVFFDEAVDDDSFRLLFSSLEGDLILLPLLLLLLVLSLFGLDFIFDDADERWSLCSSVSSLLSLADLSSSWWSESCDLVLDRVDGRVVFFFAESSLLELRLLLPLLLLLILLLLLSLLVLFFDGDIVSLDLVASDLVFFVPPSVVFVLEEDDLAATVDFVDVVCDDDGIALDDALTFEVPLSFGLRIVYNGNSKNVSCPSDWLRRDIRRRCGDDA